MTLPLRIVSSMATRRVLEELVGTFARRTGTPAVLNAMGGVEAAKSVRAGTHADVVVLASPVVAQLEAEGHVAAGTRRDFARSSIALAVRSGMPHPSLASEDDVRNAMRVGRVGYSTGPSGDHLKALWAKWGLVGEMAQRTMQAPPGMPVGEMLAKGDIDLGVQQFSELRDVPGIEIVGRLPPEIQATTIFAAGLLRDARRAAAEELIAFLVSPDTAEAKLGYGLEI